MTLTCRRWASSPFLVTAALPLLSLFSAAQGPVPGTGSEPAAAEGHVIMKSDGEPITAAELDTAVAYLKTYIAGRSDREIQIQALESELIPTAAVKAFYRDRLPEMKKRIDEHRARIVAGTEFAKVARVCSECSSSGNGGDLGSFDREQMVPQFSRVAFTLRKGVLSEPFLSVFGYHFLTVTGVRKGLAPAQDQVTASHVLVLFDKNDPQNNRQQKIMANAKVEVVDPAYNDLIPEKYKKSATLAK